MDAVGPETSATGLGLVVEGVLALLQGVFGRETCEPLHVSPALLPESVECLLPALPRLFWRTVSRPRRLLRNLLVSLSRPPRSRLRGTALVLISSFVGSVRMRRSAARSSARARRRARGRQQAQGESSTPRAPSALVSSLSSSVSVSTCGTATVEDALRRKPHSRQLPSLSGSKTPPQTWQPCGTVNCAATLLREGLPPMAPLRTTRGPLGARANGGRGGQGARAP
mmetsp:Transcript_11924/g.37303  ORF Transcript_11924/g.37303 Transcript_11924/m.37303 type:complete len:226 (+) Transcript_11924:1-678(+)